MKYNSLCFFIFPKSIPLSCNMRYVVTGRETGISINAGVYFSTKLYFI